MASNKSGTPKQCLQGVLYKREKDQDKRGVGKIEGVSNRMVKRGREEENDALINLLYRTTEHVGNC